MKWAILSDIHANLEAFKQVLADMAQQQVAGVVCLGDNIGYGPEPEAVVRLVREREIPCVMGNHELVVAQPQYLEKMNPTPRASALLTEKLISQETRDYILGLRPAMVFHGALCVHGCPPHSVTTYLFQVATGRFPEIFRGMEERLCFAGHTHDLGLIRFDGSHAARLPLARGTTRLERKDRYIVNVGSVGQPRDGNNNAKYVLWDQAHDTIEVRFVPYDIAKTAEKILALGFPEFNARRLW